MSGRIKAARAGYSGDANYQRAMPGTGYAGDPGVFGFLGKLAGRAAQFVPGGSAAVSIARGLAARLGASRARRRQRQLQQQQFQIPAGGGRFPMQPFTSITRGAPPPRATAAIRKIQSIELELPQRGSSGAPIAGRGTAIMAGEGGSCPTGYKPNKTGYWITSPQGTPSYVSPGERCVKIRKRNPLNPRAWDRAYGRLKSSKRWQKKIAAVTFREKCP